MKGYRSYQEMTADEKRHTVYLWNQFYNAQLKDDFISSWNFWLERVQYLHDIGVDIDTVKEKKEINQMV